MAKRAARGAGYAWGACEDAAAATAWLARHGFPAIAALYQALSCQKQSRTSLITDSQPWQSKEPQFLCPLYTSAAITDHIDLERYNGEISVTGLNAPLLVAGCIAAYGDAMGRSYRMTWDKTAIDNGDAGALRQNSSAELLISSTNLFTCARLDSALPDRQHKRFTRIPITASHWVFLEQLAARTYAPATEASRLSGAGPSG